MVDMTDSGPLRLRFETSAPDHHHLPPATAEVTVLGRSNVGKSSLINALASAKATSARATGTKAGGKGGGKGDAIVSKTPGRTRLLNYFRIGPGTGIVDCPGYGYASASKRERAAWQAMVDDYLLGREALTMAMLLIDGEIGPTPLDTDRLDWLRQHQVPHTVVATKHDKVKSSRREKRKRELAAGCQLERQDIVWVSTRTGVGIDRLRDLVRLWLQ